MAEARDEDDEIFVYTGGDQEVPEGVLDVSESINLSKLFQFHQGHSTSVEI